MYYLLRGEESLLLRLFALDDSLSRDDITGLCRCEDVLSSLSPPRFSILLPDFLRSWYDRPWRWWPRWWWWWWWCLRLLLDDDEDENDSDDDLNELLLDDLVRPRLRLDHDDDLDRPIWADDDDLDEYDDDLVVVVVVVADDLDHDRLRRLVVFSLVSLLVNADDDGILTTPVTDWVVDCCL